MGDEIKPVGTALVLFRKPLADGPPPEDLPVESEPVEQISFWQYPHLFTGFRNSFLPLQEKLDGFVSWQMEKLQRSQELNFRNAVQVDPSIKETIKDLIPVFSKNSADLIDVLRKRLITSADFWEKIIILKVFFSIENEEELFNSFLLPALEKRKEFENSEANYEFCSSFLSSLDKDSLNKIITNLDYGKLKDIDTLAKSLLKISPPDQIFDSLMAVNEKLTSDNDGSPERIRVIEKVQKLIIATMHCLKDSPGYVPVEHLKALYETVVKVDLKREVINLFALHHPGGGKEIFKDVILGEEDDNCEDCRRNRFYAVESYVKVAGVNAVSKLIEFLDKEKDPFVASYICYNLAKKCNEGGKEALKDLIVKHIRQGKLSIPFGCTVRLAEYGDEYKIILKNILCKPYKGNEGLKKAFINLKEVDLCNVSKSENGTSLFYTTPRGSEDLVMAFINQAGLKNLIEWVTKNEEKMSYQEKFLKENSLEVLDYAWHTQKDKMTALCLQIMPLGEEYSDLKLKSKQLVGVGLSGNDKM